MIYEIPSDEYTVINAQFPSRIEFGFQKKGTWYFDDSVIPHLDIDYDAVFQALYTQTLAQYLSGKTQVEFNKNPSEFGFQTTLQTSSTEYSTMAGMSVTPEEGKYYIKFGAYGSVSKTNEVSYAVFKNGTQIYQSVRSPKPRANQNFELNTDAALDCNGTDVIDIRYKTSNPKATLKIYNRNLITLRLE